MKRGSNIILVAALAFAGLSVAPVSAQGVLGKIVSIDSGKAGNDSLVNVGLGGGSGSNSGNVLDLNVGGGGNSNSLASANVSLGGPKGLVDVEAGLLGDNVTADVNVGGPGGLLDVDIGVGGPGTPGIPGIPGGPGVPGGPGGTLVGSLGDLQLDCSALDGQQVLQLATQSDASNSAIAGWQRASNVQIVPVALCPQARTQVAQVLRSSGKIRVLQNAAAGDVLISASLSRTNHDAGDVFAVQRKGSMLIVYVI